MKDLKSKSTGGKDSPAQLVDKFLQRTAIGVFLLSLSYVMSATVYVVGNEAVSHIGTLKLILSALVLMVVFPAFIKYLKLRLDKNKECPDTGGYVMEVSRRAGVMAFSLTFVFLIVIEWMAGGFLAGLPAPFFINAILAFTLGVFSITFYFLLRGEGDDDLDDEFDMEPGR
jgi:hypothetical protein